jgi:hypothetical protein
MNLTEKGFDLTFTEPLDESSAVNPDHFKFRHYYYKYHSKYGSDQFDVQNVPVTRITISKDRKKVSLILAALKTGYVYELSLGDIKTETGASLTNNLICYTLNKLR